MAAVLHILIIASILKHEIGNSWMKERVWLVIVSSNSGYSAEKLIINKDQGACITLWFWSCSCSLEMFACLRMAGSGSYLEYKVSRLWIEETRQVWAYMRSALDFTRRFHRSPAAGEKNHLPKGAGVKRGIQISAGACIRSYKYHKRVCKMATPKGPEESQAETSEGSVLPVKNCKVK